MSKLKSNEELTKQFGESREKIRRYIRLTELVPELLELVDNSLIKNSVLTIGVTSAVEMSYLSKDAQKLLYGVIIYSETTPTLSQARRIRKLYEDKKLTFDSIEEILDEGKFWNKFSKAFLDCTIGKRVLLCLQTDVDENGLPLVYEVVVKGDVNSDGKISSADYIMVKNHIMDVTKLGELQNVYADANKDGKVNSADYIAIKNTSSDGAVNNVMYIDDVVVNAYSCPSVMGLNVKNITSKSAEIDCQYDPELQYKLLVNTTMNFKEDARPKAQVFDVQSFPYKLENLEPATQYHFMVYTVCDGVTAPSPVNSFVTSQVLAYDQDFNVTMQHCPDDWMRAKSPSAASQFANNNPFTYLTSYAANGSWSTQNVVKLSESGLFSTGHTTIKMVGGQQPTTAWLFSPVFELSNAPHQYVTFDLALTVPGAKDAIPEDTLDNDDRFMVIVSEDAGKTWKRDNTTMWNWNTGENTCLDIPHTGEQYSLDLTKYAGKAIMVAFYIEANAALGRADIHLDNVHINAYAEDGEVATICETLSYENEHFSLQPEDLEVGKNDFVKWDLAQDRDDNLDTCYALSVNVTPMQITELTPAYMCENGVYSDNENQFINLYEAGIYKRKLTAHNGCDSIVVLNLNAYPVVETQVFDTICQGMKLTWNGNEYYMTGVYRDTLTASTGCDSIVTLILKVNDAIRHTEYVDICYGETYDFFGETISTSGSYEKLIKTPGGCDSLITLVATVLKDYSNIVINAVIAKGETYNENGFVGLTQPGSYRLPLKSKIGDCDSIITLNLVVGDATDYEEVNICFGETYQFGSQTISTSGQYIETFAEDSVVLLNATVLPDLRQTIDANICKGESYNKYGFKNLTETGVYTQELLSVDGCDSTITLNLRVLNGETIYVTDTVTTDELPYEYMNLYYDIATAPGTYKETIEIEAENCKDIIVHTLVVLLGDAVENVESLDLVLVPNPVKANNTLYVEAEFTVNERKDMLVEVFNAIGQRIYVDTPNVYPIAINGLSERGVYVVRIITGEGSIYQGKVVVK